MPSTHSLSAFRDRLAYRTLCFLDRFRRNTPTRLATTRCATFPRPNSVDDNYLYVTRAGRLRKWASFRCPGNCGKIVRLRLASSESPHWTVDDRLAGSPHYYAVHTPAYHLPLPLLGAPRLHSMVR